ncbi:MAG: DUF4157 domain-containing protein [Ilumatobacteraceae bacterium]
MLRRLAEARADAGPGAGAAVFATGTSRVHRSSSPRPATVGAAGGDAPEGFETRLAAVRPSGRPLDDVLRAPMEQAFGTDFGRIRLHDSAGSAAHNDEIGARAFTIGSDIFTRDPIDASAPAGQRLLAHELAHTVQQGGRSDGAARTVRRAVGFEFEVGRWTLKAVEDPIDPTQVDGTNEVPTTDLVRFTKDHVVHAGTGFNLKPDEADDGSWHLEFVVEPPLQEVPAGRSRLKTVMKALQKFSARLVAAGPSAAVRVQGSADDWLLSESAGLNQRGWLMMPQSDMVGEPQTTGGVRLDQLADLMAIMATGSIIGETASESTARKIGGGYLTGKNAGDADLAGASPAEARARFADFPGRALHSPTTASKELISLLALIRTYLIKAATPAAYAKSIAPIMARTDFGTIFAAIPEAQYYRTYPNQWVALNLHVAGQGGQGAQPFFSGTSTYVDPAEWADIQNAMSRTDWLSTMTTGVDLLTVDHFPDPNVAGHLFGFGKLGGATDTVGKPGRRTEVQAPIFELRRMAGSIDYRVWPTLALELFDYFVALNRQKETTFTATKTRAKQWSV